MQQARHFGRKFALQILLVFGDKFQFNNRAQTSVLGANRRYLYRKILGDTNAHQVG